MGAPAIAVVLPAILATIPAAGALDINLNVTAWLEDPGYKEGGTIKEQIQCYALPYGAWGFASHVLTYYTVLCLAKGISPGAPWHELSKTGRSAWWNAFIGVFTMLFTVTLAILTILRCRNSWQFIAIAVWKLLLSITLCSITIHAGRISAKRWKTQGLLGGGGYIAPGGATWSDGQYMHAGSQKNLASVSAEAIATGAPNPFNKILWWGFLYFPGAIAGFVGIVDLVRQHFNNTPNLSTISIAFIGAGGGCTLLLVLSFVIRSWTGKNSLAVIFGGGVIAIAWALVILTVLTALYTDWALGALHGDLTGTPTANNKYLYFLYWAAKRIPMFSF